MYSRGGSDGNILLTILEVIASKGKDSRITDFELYEELRRRYEISYSDLLKYLMILELRGLITVVTSTKFKIISLTEEAKSSLGV